MIQLTAAQVWGILGLISILIALLGCLHHAHLNERLKKLNVYQDDQVKYFSTVVSIFLSGFPILVGAMCAAMLVYSDYVSRLG